MWRNKKTEIFNNTEHSIVLMEMDRLVWGKERLLLKKGESGEISIKNDQTYFQLGVLVRSNDRDEKTQLYIDQEELSDYKRIIISFDAEQKNFQVTREPS
ncbi:hypothetical protein O6H91_03G010100 [Diphasiastrum complanatum]|uniref:Uncharacterized protein n=2 Tax=Diphasiastrum complanatum TaxID=34168 RepID=A0ACC2E3E4_DIPCM|nr:hypothetical protein O6H91_03G010100 [Diphasiastrum complanatum]KAJ7561005.1 hypothetical protein O6H91_03G010100 [Diphasiastrum complanatum]